MKKRIIYILKIVGILFSVLLGIFVYTVRFSDNKIILTKDNKIVLDYDEESKEYIINGFKNYKLKGKDGPYIYLNKDSVRIVSVTNSENGDAKVTQKLFLGEDNLELKVFVDNIEKDSFYINLDLKEPIRRSVNNIFTEPDSILVFSDIEGNFNALHSLLLNNHVINTEYEWIYGSGHVVFVGDLVDRGVNVTQCMWLILELQRKALEKGGRFHFVLGNHELMNFDVNTTYVSDKYLALGQQISKTQNTRIAFDYLNSNSNYLSNWLKSQPAMLKIGDYLFVHAGISSEFYSSKLTLSEINKRIYERLIYGLESPEYESIISSTGPLWYRGLVVNKRESLSDLNEILEFYEAKKLIIGHTVVQDISQDYDSKLIRIDVLHGIEKYSEQSKALLIKEKELYVVNGAGERKPLLE